LRDLHEIPHRVLPVDSDVVKALWNYFLLHGDASGGMHNPEFVFEVIEATQARLIAWRASLLP
jgi:hypothetical protein